VKTHKTFKFGNILKDAAETSSSLLGRKVLVSVLSLALLYSSVPLNLAALQDAPPPAQDDQASAQGAPAQGAPAPPYAQKSPDQLQQLVAPIALYPDSLVAQILAASTFPEQVVEADRFVQDHPDLKGDALAQAVNDQPWDPSVKALCAFPSVLGNMDKNLSWTSSLGDAYYNQQQDVMNAVQEMRHRAERAGHLQSTPQQTVTEQGPNVVIQPADPQVVYVPAYNPWLVYGGPIVAWPGWYPYPGIWFGGPFLSFGVGFGIGFWGHWGWGFPHWGFNWYNHSVLFNHNVYVSHSSTFYNRGAFYHGGGPRGGFRPGAGAHPFNGNHAMARGYAEPHGQAGVRSGAFSGYDRGGQARGYASRGRSSMGAAAPHFGGGARGGGGGAHGGGGGRR
jgi:Protein of unknown function (DUF3300)